MYTRFLNELRHRRVLRAVAVYAVGVVAVVEMTDIVVGALDLPDMLLTAVIILALSGIPLAAILAWSFDLTSQGIVRGTSAPQSTTAVGGGSQVLSWVLVVVLAAGVAFLSNELYWQTHNNGAPDSTLRHGKSIAVLPFVSITAESDPDTSYFSEGVAQEILSALGRVDGLRVAARTSSFAFANGHDARAVGKALNVSTVLEGSVRLAADQLRVTAELIDTTSGFELWSEVYDYELADVFRIQDEIARSIVGALAMELLGDSAERLVQPGTSSIEAYDVYLRGRHLLAVQTPDAVNEAKLLFEQALELDPDYAQAYTGLADSWIALREIGNLTLFEATRRSHDAISEALRLNNQLAEAQTSLGLCILGAGGTDDAARQFIRAIELDPEYTDAYMWRANLLRDQGYLVDAIRVYNQALALDPLNRGILENQALLFAYQGRFDRSLRQLDEVAADQPGRLTTALALAEVQVLAGDFEGALDNAQKARNLAPESPLALAALVEAFAHLARLDDAGAVLEDARILAPDNETVMRTTLQYYLLAGQYAKLDALAMARAQARVDNPGMRGTAIEFERLIWAAKGRLILGDAETARKLLEEIITEPDQLDPRPQSVHAIALLARAMVLQGDPETASAAVESGRRLAERARIEGWAAAELEYALAALCAAIGELSQALAHLESAAEAGWRGIVLVRHNPTMASLRELPEYQTRFAATAL